MSETRHSETLIWVCIAVLGLSMIGAQVLSADRPGGRPSQPIGHRLSNPRAAPAIRFAIPKPAPAVEPVVEEEPISTVDLFLEAIVQVESAGDPHCVGLAGERGLMQLKQAAWQEAAATIFAEPPSYDQAFDPVLNRRVGQAYLARLQDFLLANRSEWNADMRALLAACYNAGPSRVEAAGFAIRHLPAHTRSYVERVTALHDYYLANPADQLFAARVPSDRTP